MFWCNTAVISDMAAGNVFLMRYVMYGSIKFFAMIFGCFLLFSSSALGCVGKTLYVGATESANDKVLAEIVALLINERTGTSVQIRYLADRDALYAGLKASEEEKRVDILVEDTANGLKVLGLERQDDPDQEYLTVKDRFEKEFNIIWLNPLGFTAPRQGEKPTVSAPILRTDILTNFPLLPRILNKLGNKINNEAYGRLVSQVEGGDKPKNVARDFLKVMKFI